MNDANVAPWQSIHDELGVSAPAFVDRPLGSYIEEHALAMPDQTALRYLHRNISYAELNAASNRLANALHALGVGKDDVVGFHMPNVPQYVMGIIAVSKLGCAGSGVSPLLVPGELAYQIQDANISVLVSLDGLANSTLAGIEELPACLKTVIVASATDYIVDDMSALTISLPALSGVQCITYPDFIAAAPQAFEQRDVHWNDTFMIQYTGGTTGRPKGAMLSVRNIMHDIDCLMVYCPWELYNETQATAFPLFHAAGMSVIIAGLRYGARVFLIPNPRDLDHFCEQLVACPPTRLAAVPTMFQMLLKHPVLAKVDLSHLKLVVSGAAPLASEDRDAIEALVGNNLLSDVYGMTEAGPVHVCNPAKRAKSTAVGIPLPGMDTRVVDLETGQQEMPVGEPGEVVTSGPHVMKGYLNLPEESAKALREWRGKTWMYTGDVGFMDEEGYITLCDRAKDMLIVGGFKVFSVELEDKLCALDYIVQPAVVGAPDTERPGNDIVNLFVQLNPEAAASDPESTRSDITEFCRTNMSAYKVPKVIHIVDEVPLTPVGKIDKKRLRDMLSQA